jgi:hypothetical protein
MTGQAPNLCGQMLTAPLGTMIAHHKRKALFFVSATVGLQTAAEAVVEDQSAVVAAWLRSGDIRPSTDGELESEKASRLVRFIILQPYVLVEDPEGDS